MHAIRRSESDAMEVCFSISIISRSFFIIHIYLLCTFFMRGRPTKQEEIQLLHRHDAHDGRDAASKRKQARQGVASDAAQGP